MASLKEVKDGSDHYILLVDKFPSSGTELSSPALVSIIPVETIGIPNLYQMLFRYNITEANTAVKPFFMKWLFKKGYRKVIYLDPDIYVYQSLEKLFELLDPHDMVLIPHLTNAPEDDKKPGELDIIKAGTYNLGCIALKNTPNVDNFLNWWAPKLVDKCLIRHSEGIFVDQKWIDLAPGMFDRVYILRDDAYDVAYWNLAQRPISIEHQQPLVNGRPLVFFHFSGLDPFYPKFFSKHQNRYTLSDLPTVKKLAREYIRILKINGLKRFNPLKYTFDTFSDGTAILDIFRYIYQTNPHLVKAMGNNPFENKPSLFKFLNQPVDDKLPLFTNFANIIHQLRPDLQAVFPSPRENHGSPYLNWFIEKTPQDYGVSGELVDPIKDSLKKTGSPSPPAIQNKLAYFTGYSLYRMAYKYKDHGYFRWISPNARQKIKRSLIKVAPYLLRASKSSDHPPPPQPLPCTGVNVIAYISANLGVGEAGRMVIKSLHARQVNTRAIDCSQEEKVKFVDPTLPVHNEFHYKASIFAVNADRTLWAYEVYRPMFKGKHYIIGFWNWELPEWPEQWCASFDYVDEVWAPSSFCQEAIARKSPVPVVKMPYCIDPDNMQTDLKVTRDRFSLPKDRFIFLYMFDIRSFIERKNPLGVIEAFKTAFPPSHKGVHLIIKLNNSYARSSSLKLIQESIGNNPNITILNEALDRKSLNTLISLADCYVSLHRSEGFGFPIAEAMYLKKPVIATQWSGNVDFMNNKNSFLVGYRLIEIKEDIGPYQKGQIWAEPDLLEAACHMTRVYEDGKLGAAVGEQAHQYIATHLSPGRVGKLYTERLKKIGILEEGPGEKLQKPPLLKGSPDEPIVSADSRE